MQDTGNILEALSNLGFSRSQSLLYLQLLKAGPSTIAETAREMNTSRQAIYLLLPELLDRGLVKEIKPNKRSLYQALPPSQLSVLVGDVKDRVESIVPLLTNLQVSPAEVPLVTIYDSPLSMREWYRNYLENMEESEEFLLYSSGNLENWYQLDPEFYKNYMEQQEKKRVKLLCLLGENKRSKQHKKEVGWSVREYRHTATSFSTKVEQWIWKNQVCYLTISGNKSSLIVLQSDNLAKFARAQFYEIWETARSSDRE